MSEMPQNIVFQKPLDGELVIQGIKETTPRGYELIAIIYFGETAKGSFESNGGYSSSNDKMGAGVPATAYYVPYGVYQKSKDKSLIDMQTKYDDLGKTLRDTVKELGELNKAHLTKINEFNAIDKKLTISNQDLLKALQDRDDASKKALTMGEDIAKLRTAIGEIEFNRITQSNTQNSELGGIGKRKLALGEFNNRDLLKI